MSNKNYVMCECGHQIIVMGYPFNYGELTMICDSCGVSIVVHI